MWTITQSFLENADGQGVSSVDYPTPDSPALPFCFRLLDADDIVYIEGVSDDDQSENAFAPLDDFGEGYAGCTKIEYKRNGDWMRL